MAVSAEDDVSQATTVAATAGGGIGSDTATAGVPRTKLLPPVVDCLTRLTMLDYEAAATAHPIACMIPIGDVSPSLTQDVAVNGTVFYLSEPVADSTGGAPASGDWIAVKGGDGIFYHFKVAGYVAGPPAAITITATSGYGDANGTGVPVAIPSGRRIWFFGSPTADHAKRIYTPKASAVRTWNGSLMVTPKTFQPMIIHSANDTNALVAFHVNYDNPKPTT